MSRFPLSRIRHLAVAGTMSALVLGATAGVAYAADDNAVDLTTPGSSVQMPTWFLGGTQVCAINATPDRPASIEVFAGTHHNNHTWEPHDTSEWCWPGSFWGLHADVINRSASGTTLAVYEPFGPSPKTGPKR